MKYILSLFFMLLLLFSCQSSSEIELPGVSENPDPLEETPSCMDGIMNGSETAIDCGGDCDPCEVEEDEPQESDDGIIRFVDASITGSLVTGDLNGDGNTDLVFSIRTTSSYSTGGNDFWTRVLFGNGAGSFGNSSDIPGFSRTASNKEGGIYVCKDLNNDGIDDFAYTGDFGIEAYSGNTGGKPTALFTTREYSGSPIRAFDLNENGYKDFLSATKGGSNINYFGLYINDGASLAPVIPIGSIIDDEPKSLALGNTLDFTIENFDNAAGPDILALSSTIVGDGNQGEDRIAIALFPDNGDGGFDYPTQLQLLPFELHQPDLTFDGVPKEMAAGDFDKDGDLDLAITSSFQMVQIVLNDGEGNFTISKTINVGIAPFHILAADFDQDTNLDLVTTNDTTNDLTIAFGDGNGEFRNTKTIQLTSSVSIYDLIVDNLDDNDFPDIAIAENGTNPPGFGLGSIQIIFNPGQ